MKTSIFFVIFLLILSFEKGYSQNNSQSTNLPIVSGDIKTLIDISKLKQGSNEIAVTKKGSIISVIVKNGIIQEYVVHDGAGNKLPLVQSAKSASLKCKEIENMNCGCIKSYCWCEDGQKGRDRMDVKQN